MTGLAYVSFPDERAVIECAEVLADRLASLSPELRRSTKAAYLKSHPVPDGDLQLASSMRCLVKG